MLALPLTLDAVRRPEYTGENRCLPCTGVNIVLAAAGALALAAFVSTPVALAAFALALAAIYVRGYLVPGTPALTARYLPDRVLRAFDKRPARDAGDLDVLDTLSALGAVVETPDSDVGLAPDFDAEWRARMVASDTTTPRTADLAALLDADPADIDVQYHGDGACSVFCGPDIVGRWESPAAFNADVTADAVLDARDEWRALPLTHRGELLAALRACLDTCPACHGRVELGADTVASCCRSVDVAAADCTQCGARLFEVELDPRVLDAANV
ncbi:hypothetical protein [Salarchaeum japonicum]|uniref:hypothetical protein n=1 Tax=Salarchaeum japonicum TaxID=555573 RepID=UPI003C721919